METNVNRSDYGNEYSESMTKKGNGIGNMGTDQILALAGGALLSYWGIRKFNLIGMLGAAAGGALLYRGTTGTWPGNGLSRKYAEVDIKSSQVIDKPRAEVYAYWRNLENLPKFMSHLEHVREIDEKKSHWTAEIPGGLGTIDWKAEIIQEEADRIIAWQSLPDSDIHNSGEVRFEDAPGGKTRVESMISYRPPAGEIGELAAKLFNPAFKAVVKNDLKQFKKIMEKGGEAKMRSQPRSRVE